MSAPYESNNTCSLQHELPLAQIPIQILYVARPFFAPSLAVHCTFCQNRFLAAGGQLPARAAASQVWYGGTSSQIPAVRKCLTCTRRLTTSASSPIFARPARDLGSGFPNHGQFESGALHGTRKGSLRCQSTRGLFSYSNSVPDRTMEPKPAHETHYHRNTTYFPKIIAVSAVDRSQNSTQPSKSMPLSKELKLSLPNPAPDLEHELAAVLPEIPPGAPLGYSM